MAGLLPKTVSRRYLQPLSLREFPFRSCPEEVCDIRRCSLTLLTTNLYKVVLTQICQLNVISPIQKGARLRAYTETPWTRSTACQADDREAVGTANVRSIRRLHFVHSSQECDSFDITATHVEEDAAAVIVNRLNLVALTIAPDRNNGVGLRQDELLRRVKRILEVPEHLRWGTDR